MTIILEIQGREYIPLIAAPYFTGGLVDVEALARVLARPDVFADPENQYVMTAIRVMPDGELVVPKATVFGPFGSSNHALLGTKLPMRDAASILVPAGALKSLFDLLNSSLEKDDPLFGIARWNWTPEVPKDVGLAIRENCSNPFGRRHLRKNSRAKILDRFRDALDELVQRAGRQNISIRLDSLPGRKHQLLEILRRIDPELADVAETTFKDDYSRELGWKWKTAITGEDESLIKRLARLR